MRPILERMLDDMRLRNLAISTQASYIHHVSMFARHFDKSPEIIAPEEIRSYQLYLSKEKKAAPTTVAIAVSALRFLYSITLQRSWMMEKAIPMPKRPEALPSVLSPDEVLGFLECVRQAKHRTILMSCYAAGLRISEVVRLKPGDVDNRRMVIRVEQGKGRRDRYVMLSPRLLETLDKWRALGKTQKWLFPGNRSENPITRHAVEKACREAHRLSGISKPVTPHSLRHAFAVHILESGTDIRTIQLLLGHSSISTTANYLRLATTQVCSATSPLDLLPRPIPLPAHHARTKPRVICVEPPFGG
ncbi:MAG: integrase [Acidobacteria bacterium]|nr:MAG: integrase [Acidobacteriota bacterium]